MSAPILPRQDLGKTVDGIWVDWEGGVRFKIARLNNSRYKAEVARQKAAIAVQSRTKRDASTADDNDAVRRAASSCILLDWSGIKDENGEAWSWSPERALELMTDPQWEEIATFVMAISQEYALYRTEAAETAEGN